MKILLCTDGSRDALNAVRMGGVVAQKLGADVTLLCSVENRRISLEAAMEQVNSIMKQTVDEFELIGRRGQMIEQMLTEILQKSYDLVIVGYQSRSFLEKAIWGSLAARIAHELPLSVLIVRGWREVINQVLVGISGRGFTDECVEWAGRIAAAFGGCVTLLHASATPPLMYGGLEEVVETLSELLETDTAEAQALKRAVAQLGALGVETDVELTHGLAERELLRVAQDRDVDMLVIGSSWAAEPMHRFFVRNITEQILLNTERPVLVVRPGRVSSVSPAACRNLDRSEKV